jgi:serine/threonine-protein kinase RsbW
MTDSGAELGRAKPADGFGVALSGPERHLNMLAEAAAVLTAAGDYESALRRLAELAVPELADLCLIDVRDSRTYLRRVAGAYHGSAPRALVDELVTRYPPVEGSKLPAARAVETGAVSWVAEMGDELLAEITRDERHLEVFKSLGVRSYLCVPIVSEAEILGAITLVSAGSGRHFDEQDLEVPRLLAREAAVALRWALQGDRERDLAAALQERLLPRRLPPLEGMSIAVRYAAGTGSDVGGDFYDIAVLPSGTVGLMVGDVAGHDAEAAVVMGQLRAATRALAGQVHDPAALVEVLQWSWPLLDLDLMATALFARLDIPTRTLKVASAGHVPPLVCDSGGPRFMAVPTAPLLGARGPAAENHIEVLEAGATLVLYTDGLVERRGRPIEAGMAAVAKTVGEMCSRSPQDVCDALIAELVAQGPLQDDVAVMLVRVD